mgnify:CR=1 FL=1
MDWNKCVLIGAQVVIVIVLGTLVALGHNNAVTDGLLAVSGSIAGIGVLQTVAKKNSPSS